GVATQGVPRVVRALQRLPGGEDRDRQAHLPRRGLGKRRIEAWRRHCHGARDVGERRRGGENETTRHLRRPATRRGQRAPRKGCATRRKWPSFQENGAAREAARAPEAVEEGGELTFLSRTQQTIDRRT